MPIQKITRSALLTNSIRVFRRQGYYRTNMSDLAKASGLTKGAFYHHFANKADVMLHCLQATTAAFERKVFALAYAENVDGATRLQQLSEATFQIFTVEEGGCFFANTLLETVHVEEQFLEEIKRFFQAWKAAVAHIFTEKYPAAQAEQLAQQILIDIEGAIIFMQLHNDIAILHQSVKRCIGLF